MKRFIVVVLALSCAQPALALSCLKPDVVGSFQQASESDQTYSIVLGALQFDSDTPPFDGTMTPSTSIPATFQGRILGADGFATDVAAPVTLKVSCLADAQVCGSAGEPDTRVIAFLRHSDGTNVLDLDPCPRWLFADPTVQQLESMANCATGGACTPQP